MTGGIRVHHLAHPPAGPQPRRGTLEERAVDLDLLVGGQRLGGEVLGCLDAGDRVVRLAGLMVQAGGR
jgi:hypothetical protein